MNFALKFDPGSKKNYSIDKSEYKKLIGLSKQDVKLKMGQVYNDMNADIWMYRINESFHLLRKNYLYIYFKNNVVDQYVLKKFKKAL